MPTSIGIPLVSPSTSRFVALCIALTCSLCFVVPSGYSYGSAVLCLLSIPLLLWQRPVLRLNGADQWLISTLLFCVGIHVLLMLYHGSPFRYFEEPSRFLLGIFVLLAVVGFNPSMRWWWFSLAAGTILGGVVALWQFAQADLMRAQGFMNPIQFGNLCLLMGCMCLAGLGWAYHQRQPRAWALLFLIAAMMGVASSFFSGARGGWIALPVMLVLLYLCFRSLIRRRVLWLGFLLVTGLVAVLYVIPSTGVQLRLEQMSEGLGAYLRGTYVDQSIGVRLEMWRAALTIATQKPWLGWGESAYLEPMLQLIAQPEIREQVAGLDHLHNDVLDTLVKRGLLGLMALLAVYMVPLALFARAYWRAAPGDYRVRSFALCGLLLITGVVIFGFTQAFLRHNSGVTLYAFYMVVLWGYVRLAEQSSRLS